MASRLNAIAIDTLHNPVFYEPPSRAVEVMTEKTAVSPAGMVFRDTLKSTAGHVGTRLLMGQSMQMNDTAIFLASDAAYRMMIRRLIAIEPFVASFGLPPSLLQTVTDQTAIAGLYELLLVLGMGKRFNLVRMLAEVGGTTATRMMLDQFV